MALQLTSPIVSVSWLSENLDHPDLIILDATIKKVTSPNQGSDSNQKIKNARFFDIKGAFSDKGTSIPNMLPDPKTFENACSELGISNHHAIVVYDQLGIYSSPRVWWMFKAMGFENVGILDGGLPVWNAAKLPTQSVSEASITYPKGNFTANYSAELVSGSQDIISEMNTSNTLILDARSEGRFRAIEPEPRTDLKGGHIPNSQSLHYARVLRDNHMLPKEELKEIFKNFDIGNKKLIFTCGSGITACIILLAAELAGYNNVSVYDGSWSEWGQLTGVPIVC